jgi:hypothetical protein
MWSHYAGSYKGVCIEFSTNSNFFEGVRKVEYVTETPDFFPIQKDERDRGPNVLYTKHADWEKEREWRLLSYRPGKLPFPSIVINRVIVGFAIERNYLQRVLSICSAAQIPISQVVKVEGTYGLEINDFVFS